MFLDLVLTSAENIIIEVKTGGTLGYNDHALVEFVTLRNNANEQTATHKLFKELLDEISLETVLRDKETGQSQ